MRIIINALSAKSGGIITYTNNLMRSFSERNIDATFAVSENFPIKFDAQVIRLPASDMSPLRRFIWEQTAWRRIVARHKPDILYSSANFGLLAPPVPQVLLVREGGLFDPFYLINVAPGLHVKSIFQRIARRKLIILSARSSELVLTPTDAMRQLFLSWAEDLSEKVRKNDYGTISNFSNSQPRARAWREDGILKILFVSAYYRHKQPGLISEAVARLNELGLPCTLVVTMDLEQIARTAGGDMDYFLLSKGVERGQVTMLGNVPYSELPKLYREHDLFVFPSLSETFGHPLTEAMSAGIPVIASDTPVHREVCKDSALYFSPLSPSDLVRQVQHLDEHPALRETLCENGRNNVSTHYAWEHHVDRLLEDFGRIVDGGESE